MQLEKKFTNYEGNSKENKFITRAEYNKERTNATPTGDIYSREGKKIGVYSYPIKSSKCGEHTDISVILKTSGMTDEEVEELFYHEFLSVYAKPHDKKFYKMSLSELTETTIAPSDIHKILHLQNGFLPPEVIFISIAWSILDCIDLRIDRIHELSFDTLREKTDYVLDYMLEQGATLDEDPFCVPTKNLKRGIFKYLENINKNKDENYCMVKNDFQNFLLELYRIFTAYSRFNSICFIEQEYECIKRLKELYRYIQLPNIEPNYVSKFSVELVKNKDDIAVGMPTVEW